MVMIQAARFRALPSLFVHSYPNQIHCLPPAGLTSSGPSLACISNNRVGILPTHLKSTLAGALASVHSRGLFGYLDCLESMLTKNHGGRGRRNPSSIFLPFICMALLLSPSSRAQENSPLPHRVSGVEVYESSQELHESLQEKSPLQFSASHAPALTISVSDSATYQQIDGFGASITDSSAWLLSQKLTPAQRSALLKQLFDTKQGIGLAILRQPMGSSDFSREDYSYDDMPPGESDPELKHFTIERDRQYILPVLREALSVNPNLRIIASPWSPPGWMKTSGSMIGGTLLPTSFAPLARYFVRFVEAYEADGVPIFAVTPQNEPRNIPSDYPGMGMTAEEQATFVRDYLGPAFRDAHLKTKILLFDHNWDMIDFPTTILSDPRAADFSAGTATHCYGGSPDAQTQLHDHFPAKGIWLTECSGGEWQKGNLLVEQANLIIETTRNWAQSVVLWNLALDQNHEPHLGGCKTCRGVVTIDHSTSPTTITPTVDFTALAHASKFLAPGALRIDSIASEQSSLQHVAFRNPNGSIVLLVLNPAAAPATFNIAWQGRSANYALPPSAVATFRWRAKLKPRHKKNGR
jgi:glucosylceramidase